jgi:hypothetical protein
MGSNFSDRPLPSPGRGCPCAGNVWGKAAVGKRSFGKRLFGKPTVNRL